MRKTCPQCGGKFETVYEQKVYCDVKCRKAAEAKRARGRAGVVSLEGRTCENCGAKYNAAGAKQKCCDKCRAAQHSEGADLERVFTDLEKLGEVYDGWAKLYGDWMLCSDLHAQRIYVELLRKLILVAKKFGLRQLLLNGDLFDFNMLSKYDRYKIDSTVGKEIRAVRLILDALFTQFDLVIWTIGNHDLRALREFNWQMPPNELVEIIGENLGHKLRITLYPYAEINDKWRVTHPSSYADNTGTVAKTLCHKYHKHCIVTHGHHTGETYDASGDYLAIDMGAMTHHKKHTYIMFSDTKHRRWNREFMMIRNDVRYRFVDHPNATDWSFWLGDAVQPLISPRTLSETP